MSFHLLACRPWRARGLVALPLLLAACAALAAPSSPGAGACAGSAAMAFELAIASNVSRDGVESRTVVRVHEDGCVAVQRPWFLRDAGEFELRLDARESEALRRSVGIDALRGVTQHGLENEAQALRAEDARDGAKDGAVVFHNTDPDTYTLQWRDGGELRSLVAQDVLDAAERQPKAAGLNRVAGAVRALQALGARPGKRIAAGSTP